MTKYDDAKWMNNPTIDWSQPDTSDIHQLKARMAQLEAELIALMNIIGETCKTAEATHQTMPRALSEWWQKHKARA